MGRIRILGVFSRSLYRNTLIRSLSGQTQVQMEADKQNLLNNISSEGNLNEESELKNIVKTPKPKKTFAIILAYSGLGYHGMQMNYSELPTIEKMLISALIKEECIPETCSSNLKQIGFQRSSRTDKGVSALGQVVSVKLYKSCTNLMENINAHLPPDIRVLGIKNVPGEFNTKKMCNARTYSYTLPTFALSLCGGILPDSSFRLPREDYHLINKLLSFYRGTHNFHNYTNSKLPTDKSARRHIMDIYCSEPFLHHDVEFTRILVKGHSFMLHQIRKMVCLVIAVARGLVSPDLLLHSVRWDKINIHIAPSLGLVQEKAHYKYLMQDHDRKLHNVITWEEFLPAKEAFREEKIMPAIINGELIDLSMSLWLQRLQHHDFMNVSHSPKALTE